jgi:hypothetical protein
MKVIGSVAPEEVPEGERSRSRTGVWSELARRAIQDHENGRVTMVQVDDDKELKKLRNNLVQYLRPKGYRMHPVVVRQSDGGTRVFLELRLPALEEVPRAQAAGVG